MQGVRALYAGLVIFDGDMLIDDAAVPAKDGDVVLALVDGEMTCKILDLSSGFLLPDNPNYSSIRLSAELDFDIQGVVQLSIYYVKRFT